MQHVILLSNEKVGSYSMNLRMLESMGIDDAIHVLNRNEIDITKVFFCLLGWKVKIITLPCMKKELGHLNMCHENGNLRV